MTVKGRIRRPASAWILGTVLGAGLQAAAPPPTPTPKPPARLTGGFGRIPATPLPNQESGQSLADAVRIANEAKARREQKKSVAITNETLSSSSSKENVSITNQTLVTDPKKGKLTTWQPVRTPTGTASSGSRTVASGVPPLTTPAAPDGGGEAEWRLRMDSARKRVGDLKAKVSELEAESKKLETDFYAWDDGSYRDGVIKPAWDRKREELETTRRELDVAEKELAELPETARKAGVPPGWLRE